MKQQYDEPFFLTKTEFNEVVHKECPETLQRVKDVFVVQCCFGCRIVISDDSLLIISALKKEYLTFIIYLRKHTR